MSIFVVDIERDLKEVKPQLAASFEAPTTTAVLLNWYWLGLHGLRRSAAPLVSRQISPIQLCLEHSSNKKIWGSREVLLPLFEVVRDSLD